MLRWRALLLSVVATLPCTFAVLVATVISINSLQAGNLRDFHNPAAVTAGTIITVTTTIDELNFDGDCSLREALQAAYLDMPQDACAGGSGDDIVYVPPGEYILLLGQLHLSGTLTLQGSITDTTSLDGNNQSRVLYIEDEATIRLRYLAIRNGRLILWCYEHQDCAGAGVMNQGTTWIEHSTILDNQAGTAEPDPYSTHGVYGGGIFNAGSLTLTNSTVSGNAAGNGDPFGNGHAGEIYCSLGGEGGGIANYGALALDNTTVANNRPGTGGRDSNCDGITGGLYNAEGAQVSIRNSIVADNVTNDCRGVITSLGHNIIETYAGCTFSSDVINWDGALDPLADNGGSTLTHALRPQSLAIDAGICVNSVGITVTVDQRGAPRPQGGGCDIGAYESPYTATFRLHKTSMPLVRYQPPPCSIIIPACNATNDSTTRDEEPAWSPDGQKIAFTRDQEIFVMNADGSKAEQLLDYGCRPTWSPDGSKLVFQKSCVYGLSEIYVMNADGSNPTSLADTEPAGAISPVWSPDGSKILYRDDFTLDLYVMNADGSQQTHLASNAYLGTSPWSPDSRKIVFSGPDSGIRIINVDGSNLVHLDTGASENGAPAWSPFDSTIAFICRSTAPDGVLAQDVCVISENGSGAGKLTDDQYLISGPTWSRDGTKLLFVTYTSSNRAEIVVMNQDGSQRRQLTNTPAGQWTDQAIWAPDSGKIAFVRGGEGNLDIYILGIDEE